MNAQQEGTELAANGSFTTTNWSTVLNCRGDPAKAGPALAKLCQIYWFPLYAFARRSGHAHENAEDLTQDFFRHLIEHRSLEIADAGKGRFRSFLLVLLKRFMINEWHRTQRQKRGGGCIMISIDGDAESRYAAEGVQHVDPEKAFDQRWAMSVLDQALNRLECEYAAADNGALFGALRVFLTGEKGESPYAKVAIQLGMNENTVKSTVRRMRQRYRELLRMEIARTVATPREIDDEIRYLFRALS